MMRCSMFITILTWIVLWLCSSFISSLAYCPGGTYMFKPTLGKEACEYCPTGTFMPYHDHTYMECFKCTQIVNSTLEILKTQCTQTQNSIIHCMNGYFRRFPMNIRETERCEKCYECMDVRKEIISCTTYADTHCCPADHFVVLPDRNGVPGCWETPYLCRQGEYFELDDFLCHPCPPATFMSLDYHSMTQCWPCQSPSERTLHKYAVITQQCNRTHPPLVECQDGFYISHSMGYRNEDIGCSLCTNCSNDPERKYEGRKCVHVHDTVCCPVPNMTVVDTPDGPSCVVPAKTPSNTEKPPKDSNHEPYKTTVKTLTNNPHTCAETGGLSVGAIIGVTVVVVYVILVIITMAVVFSYRHCLKTKSKCLKRRDVHQLKENVEALQLMNARDKTREYKNQDELCEKCQEHEIDMVVLQPCRHVITADTCMNCSVGLTKCTVCKEPVTDTTWLRPVEKT